MTTRNRFSPGRRWAALVLPFLLTLPPEPSAAGVANPQREYRAAVIEIENILRQNPDGADARRRLGLLNLEWGRGPAAEEELRRAIALGAVPEPLQIPLAESLLMQGKFQEVLDQRMPMTLLSARHQATLLAYRGEAWLGLDRSEKAEEEFGRALQMDPGCTAAKLGMARLAQSRRNLDEARRLVAEVLAASPDDPKAWSLQGGLFEAAQQFDQAEASYGKAMALKRFSPIERASRALIRINTGRLDAAQADLDVLKREAPEFFLTLYTEGVMNLQMEQYGEAQLNLERALKLNDRFNSINYYLGVAHYFQGHEREAEKYLQTFAAYQPEVVEARLFLATLKFRKSDYEEARALLNTALAQQPGNLPALKLMSDLEFLSGHSEKGLKYLRQFSELDRQRIQARKGKGSPAADGVETLDMLAALDIPREIDPRLARNVTALVLRHLRAGEFDQARRVADKIRAKAPGNPLADNLTGLIYLARNAPEKAKPAFEAALEKKPGDPAITLRLARLALRDKDSGAARRLYEQALARNPGNLSLRMHLAELDAHEGKTRDMLERLTGIIRDYPTDLEPRMTLASKLLNAGQPGRAQAILEDIKDGYPRNPALTTLLIRAQLDNRQAGQALATAKVFAADEPQSAMAHYLLANAYAQDRDVPHMRQSLEKAMSLDRKFLPARHSFIRLLVGQRDFERADAELRSLAGEYPDDVEVLLLKGWVASARNRFPEALAASEAAWKKARTTETVTGLAKARWQTGDRSGAVGLLEDWIGAHPDDAMARIAAADFHAAANETDPAIRHLEQVLKTHPENTLVMNNLAWLYRKTDPDKALGAARQAASLAPHAPDVLDTLAMIELDQGAADKAVDLLAHAGEMAPAQKPIRYHLALALDKAGKRPEAVRVLKEVLDDNRFFPERKEAGALLEKLSAN